MFCFCNWLYAQMKKIRWLICFSSKLLFFNEECLSALSPSAASASTTTTTTFLLLILPTSSAWALLFKRTFLISYYYKYMYNSWRSVIKPSKWTNESFFWQWSKKSHISPLHLLYTSQAWFSIPNIHFKSEIWTQMTWKTRRYNYDSTCCCWPQPPLPLSLLLCAGAP